MLAIPNNLLTESLEIEMQEMLLEISKDQRGVLDTVIMVENNTKSINQMFQQQGISKGNKLIDHSKNTFHKDKAKTTIILKVTPNNPQTKTITLLSPTTPTTNSISKLITNKKEDNTHKQSANIYQ